MCQAGCTRLKVGMLMPEVSFYSLYTGTTGGWREQVAPHHPLVTARQMMA